MTTMVTVVTASNASKVYAVAVRILSRRELSEKELSDRLTKRGFALEDIDHAIEKCKKLQYLDDERYAEILCRTMVSQGKAVGRRLRFELKKRGLSADLIDRSMAEADENVVVDDLVQSMYQRRYGDIDFQSSDAAQKRRIMNYFVRRGFTISQVLTSINTIER